jgi:hypothetical protein
MAILTSIQNGISVELPAPVSIKVGEEIIWSSNTGRISSGVMVGDVIAEKTNLSISWGILDTNELNSIKSSLVSGFFPLILNISGTPETIECYRGTLSYEPIGGLQDNKYYYRNVSTDLVEQ